MKNRLAELIASEGITSSKFAELLEVQPSNISHILSGRNNPSYDFIVRVLNVFTNVNPDWLLLGIGDIYRSKQEEIVIENTENEIDLFSEADDFTNVNQEEIEVGATILEQPIEKEGNNSPALFTNVEKPTLPSKQIERVIIFYSDKSFTEYSPN